MKKLVIGTETVNVRAAKKSICQNILWLNRQIKSVNPSTEIGKKKAQFYAKNLEMQKTVLAWLLKLDAC